MTLQDLGALGEFLGLFAILVTLFYLARQTRQSVQISRAAEQRILIDQFNASLRLMTEPINLGIMRSALVSFRALDPDTQAQAFLLFVQWVNHLERARYSFESGLLPEAVVNAFETYTLAFLVTPGGREFWEDYANSFGKDISKRLTQLLQRDDGLPAPVTEWYPWLRPEAGAPTEVPTLGHQAT